MALTIVIHRRRTIHEFTSTQTDRLTMKPLNYELKTLHHVFVYTSKAVLKFGKETLWNKKKMFSSTFSKTIHILFNYPPNNGIERADQH